MSYFSYIAFPREADLSCLKNKFDQSKLVKVKDLKGRKWKKRYEGLPDDEVVYIGKSGGSNNLLVYEKNPKATFKNVFENKFIYGMNAKFNIYKPEVNVFEEDIDEVLKRVQKYVDASMTKEELLKERAEAKKHEKKFDKMAKNHVKRCRKQLYNLIKCNAKPGEIVEIYTGLLIGDAPFDFGPPKEKRVLELKEVKTSEQLEITEDGLKIEIYMRK